MGVQSSTAISSISVFFFVVFYFLLIFLHIAIAHQVVETKYQSNCPNEFLCRNQRLPTFPLTNKSLPDCGLLTLDCDAVPFPTLELGGKLYHTSGFGANDVLVLSDPVLKDRLANRSCHSFDWNSSSMSFPNSPSISFEVVAPTQFIFLFKCNRSSSTYNRKKMDNYFSGYKSYRDCKNFTLYYKDKHPTIPKAAKIPKDCLLLQLLFDNSKKYSDLFDELTPETLLSWKVSEECSKCHLGGGQCKSDSNNNFKCLQENKRATITKRKPDVKGITKKTKSTSKVKLILITVLGSVAMMIFVSLGVILAVLRCNSSKGGDFSSFFSKKDIERSSKYFGVHVFSYSELQKATNNFDPSKELGDGGFGTVYCGKLRDGREVAVKRLYEQNCKRVEQFVNEIEILTRLRHRNLVTLYGCSSRNSRSLLLVYEYIPNGTLADHLHGARAQDRSSLTWPIRMIIAIETANALAYLHASDIIHRDVKTANILLDLNFAVKVADFGLSRLFPVDVTHVSTMPQGTPGYFDPEYYECYKLTDKSDVYSFGVVLVELISSLPAVDMDRDSHEINLANFAMNRILLNEFDALIDPSLGFKTDFEVARMTTSVAELAFRCLQQRKDTRPTMYDVLETLLEIQGDHHGIIDENGFAKCSVSAQQEEFLLEKNKFSTLPNSATEKWICSTSTTSNSV